MKRIIATLACLFAAIPATAGGQEVRQDILFIGNSFTQPVPPLFVDLAIDAGWLTPRVTNRSVAGVTLDYHRNNATTLSQIDSGGWEYVLLQEYSTRPTDSGLTEADPAQFKDDATTLYDRVKLTSPDATVLLYQTWARHESHAYYPTWFDDRTDMQNQLNAHYHDAADNYIPTHSAAAAKTDVLVSPVGEAWQANYLAGGSNLHADDKYHANARGNYLSALVHYGMVYQRSTLGLAAVGGVSQAEALQLQQLADSVTGYSTPGGPDEAPRSGGVLRGSFEGPVFTNDGGFSNRVVDGWMVRSGVTNGVAVRNGRDQEFPGSTSINGVDQPLPGMADGLQYLWVNTGHVGQYLVDVLQPNTRYELSVAIGRSARTEYEDVDYFVRLFAGDALLGELTGHTDTLDSGTFNLRTLVYETDELLVSTERLRIVLGRDGANHVTSRLAFDNVHLVITPVPEPAGALLGAMLCLGHRRLARLNRGAR